MCCASAVNSAAAEMAYQRSSEHGYDPQPGPALLWLARGANEAAVAAVRRLVAEASDPVAQCRLLPAAVDVFVAAGALDEARAVAARLDKVATQVATVTLQAYAAFASGTVELDTGDAAGALPYLRKARQLWAHAQSPYEVARVRLVTGSRPDRARRHRVGPKGAGGRVRHLPSAGRDVGRQGDSAPPVAGGQSGRTIGSRSRSVAPGRVRPEQLPDRRGARTEREDGRSAPLKHFRKAGRRLPHGGGGLRLRAPPRVSHHWGLGCRPRAEGRITVDESDRTRLQKAEPTCWGTALSPVTPHARSNVVGLITTRLQVTSGCYE